MVVDYLSLSSVNFVIPDFCSPNPALAGNFLAGLHCGYTIEEARCRVAPSK
jgi:hypothetical protein